MRAITRRYADKSLTNPFVTFLMLLFGTSIAVLVGLTLSIGVHALYNLWRGDGLIMYAIALILFASSFHTIFAGFKEAVLFSYFSIKSRQSTIHKIQGVVAFSLDFFVTEVFRAGGMLLFALAAIKAATQGITIDPLLFIGTAALFLGTFIQAIVSAAYLRWSVTERVYRQTLLTDATIHEWGFLEPMMRLMRSTLRGRRIVALGTVLLFLYKTLQMLGYFVIPVILQWLFVPNFTIMLAAFWTALLAFVISWYMLVRTIIREYHAWTTYSQRVLVAGSSVIVATIGAGLLRLFIYYDIFRQADVGIGFAGVPWILGVDALFILLMMFFSRVLIEDWT